MMVSCSCVLCKPSLVFFCFVGFIGYAKDIYEIVSHDVIKNRDDDQLYYTKIYLDPELRVSSAVWNNPVKG